MCWHLAGAPAKARPMRWRCFSTDLGSTVKWTCPSSSTATARTTAWAWRVPAPASRRGKCGWSGAAGRDLPRELPTASDTRSVGPAGSGDDSARAGGEPGPLPRPSGTPAGQDINEHGTAARDRCRPRLDCVVRDNQRALTPHYSNHKTRRDAFMPIGVGLADAIAPSSRRCSRSSQHPPAGTSPAPMTGGSGHQRT